MKNVIVFALGKARYAVELRWVREVFTVGHVTPVPHAPVAVVGVVNFRGAVMPLIDLDAVLGRRSGAQAVRAGPLAGVRGRRPGWTASGPSHGSLPGRRAG